MMILAKRRTGAEKQQLGVEHLESILCWQNKVMVLFSGGNLDDVGMWGSADGTTGQEPGNQPLVRERRNSESS